MATGLELYEALKPTVGEEAAKMIAEALPMSERIATKSDLERLAEHFDQKLDAKLSALESRIYQRMLTFNITLFLGLAGMIVAIVLKG
jgi:hypothetical protein